ncbi:hypothetical protein ACFSR6_18605 [Pedobacter vanadiisoli]|uniref:Uncharacterized protein n=1 Tax=Pedobacter vanadiisoli TaxID=1761975 RepID=A0ABW5MMR8_9SPHI
MQRKPGSSAQASALKRDGSGILRFFIGDIANSPTGASRWNATVPFLITNLTILAIRNLYDVHLLIYAAAFLLR